VVSYQKTIKETLKEKHLREEETILIFSACSIPSQVVDDGDLYLFESNLSFKAILKAFPFALGALSFQGGFYFQDSLSPSTLSICENIESLSKKRKNVLIVPFSLVYNDWLTFYEIESIYLPLLRKKGYKSFLCPTISSHPVWKDSICNIFDDCNFVNNEMLTKYHEKK
jgi:protoheme ferro-lyase